mgnify:CR=1 FL=1
MPTINVVMGLCVMCHGEVGQSVGGYIVGQNEGKDVFLCDICKSMMEDHISPPIKKDEEQVFYSQNPSMDIPIPELQLVDVNAQSATQKTSKDIQSLVKIIFISFILLTPILFNKSTMNSFFPFLLFIIITLALFGRISEKDSKWLGFYASTVLCILIWLNGESAYSTYIDFHDRNFGGEQRPERLVIWLYYIIPVMVTFILFRVAMGIFSVLSESNTKPSIQFLLPIMFSISIVNLLLYNFYVTWGSPYHDLGVCGLGLVLLAFFSSAIDTYDVSYGWITSGGKTSSAVFFKFKD